jgi:hypothetical protein
MASESKTEVTLAIPLEYLSHFVISRFEDIRDDGQDEERTDEENEFWDDQVNRLTAALAAHEKQLSLDAALGARVRSMFPGHGDDEIVNIIGPHHH